MSGRAILSANWVPFSACESPSLPTAPATIMLGTMLMDRVSSLRIQGAIFHCKAPSLSIWPAIVQTIPAEVPDLRFRRQRELSEAENGAARQVAEGYGFLRNVTQFQSAWEASNPKYTYKSSARAKIVPAIGASVLHKRSWIPNRLPLSAAELVESEAPATMRMAQLTKSAKVKSETTIWITISSQYCSFKGAWRALKYV